MQQPNNTPYKAIIQALQQLPKANNTVTVTLPDSCDYLDSYLEYLEDNTNKDTNTFTE